MISGTIKALASLPVDAHMRKVAPMIMLRPEGNDVGEATGRGGLRKPIRPPKETIAALRLTSFRPTCSVAEQSALGDDFPPDCLLTRSIKPALEFLLGWAYCVVK